MGGPSPGSAYVTAQMSIEEKRVLDDAAKAAGVNRNAFIRRWIATLARKK